MDWSFQTIEHIEGARMRHSSIAIDSENKVHISYYVYYDPNDSKMKSEGIEGFRALRYVTNKSGNWTREILDSTPLDVPGFVGWFNSIATSPDGKDIYISTFNSGFGLQIFIKHPEIGDWRSPIADILLTGVGETPQATGLLPTAVVGQDDKLHLVYFKSIGNTRQEYVKYLTQQEKHSSNKESIEFEREIQEIDVGTMPSLYLDSNNIAHVAYLGYINFPNRRFNLKYATNAGGAWTISVVDESVICEQDYCRGTAISVDSKANIHIVYRDTNNRLLKYATNKSGGWQISIIDSITRVKGSCFPSMIIEPTSKHTDDIVHIIYCGDEGLMYAANSSGAWRKVIMTQEQISSETSADIAIDSNNKLHISYVTPSTLKYATNRPPE